MIIREQGFIILTAVLLISAISLAIAIGVALRSVGETNISLGEALSTSALGLANACAEEALLNLKNNLNYSGNEGIIVDEGYSCTILQVEGMGNFNRVIKTESFVGGYKRKIKIEVASVRPLLITSWQEVADF